MERQFPFGRWLRQQRKRLDLSQSALAERARCSSDTIQKIETGTRRPSREVAALLADALAVPLDERPAFIHFARGKTETSDEHSSHAAPAALHLPIQLTVLIGREDDVAQVTGLLQRPEIRLLTLVGPPGIGKTRLAIQVASTLAEHFGRQVCFVALATVEDPDLVLARIAQALDIKEVAGRPLSESLMQWLRSNPILLLLDNFEQVLDATPALLDLLGACPRLNVLITSREALHVPGEWQYPMPLLATPGTDARQSSLSMAHVAGYSAVRLFIERAMAVRPTFAITEQNAAVVAAICDRLEGLPLAIELAAARVSLLSLDELLSNIDNMLTLLSGGARFLPPRQRTLRGAIDWSYRLLSEEEQQVFTRLGTFVGGWTVDGAATIMRVGPATAHPQTEAILNILASLTNKSLVQQLATTDGESRFVMLEVMRQYANERLHASGELVAVRCAHADYYLALVEAAMPELLQGDQARWLQRLEDEHHNIRAALGWLAEGEPSAVELALRICCSTALFWDIHGHLSEGRRWLRVCLERAERWIAAGTSEDGVAPISPAVRARAYKAAGNLANKQGDAAVALRFQHRSLDLYQQIGDRRGVASTCLNLGNAASSQAEFAAARNWHQQALELFRELDDRPHIAMSLDNLGNSVRGLGDLTQARVLQEESLALRRELGDRYGESIALNNLGHGALLEGDPVRARRLGEAGLAIARDLNYTYGISYLLNHLGRVAVENGEYGTAQSLLEEAHMLSRRLGDEYGLAYGFEGLGALAQARGDDDGARASYRQSLELSQAINDRAGAIRCLERLALLHATHGLVRKAAVLLGVAAAHHMQSGAAPGSTATRAAIQALALARERLDAETLAAAWTEGRAMALEQAIAYALEDTSTTDGDE